MAEKDKDAPEGGGLEEKLAELEKVLENSRKLERRARHEATQLQERLAAIEGKIGDRDLDELIQLEEERVQLEEERARQSGEFDQIMQIKARLEKKLQDSEKAYEKDRGALMSELEDALIGDRLERAMSRLKIDDRYRPAVRALLLQKNPALAVEDGRHRAVVKDEDGNTIRLEDYVDAWSQSDEASPFMPASGASGMGAPRPNGRGQPRKSYAEMTVDDKIQYVEEHGAESLAEFARQGSGGGGQ